MCQQTHPINTPWGASVFLRRLEPDMLIPNMIKEKTEAATSPIQTDVAGVSATHEEPRANVDCYKMWPRSAAAFISGETLFYMLAHNKGFFNLHGITDNVVAEHADCNQTTPDVGNYCMNVL
jgi:hypothetical protein